MTSAAVHGPIAVLDRATEEGMPREISGAGLTLPGEAIPLLALFQPGDGHAGAELVGRLTAVTRTGSLLEAVGDVWDTRVKPGVYSCGVDLSDVNHQLLNADTREPVSDADVAELFGGILVDAALRVVSVATAARLIAVTLHATDTGRGSFPEALLTVEAFR